MLRRAVMGDDDGKFAGHPRYDSSPCAELRDAVMTFATGSHGVPLRMLGDSTALTSAPHVDTQRQLSVFENETALTVVVDDFTKCTIALLTVKVTVFRARSTRREGHLQRHQHLHCAELTAGDAAALR
jgi:hypothetical protein